MLCCNVLNFVIYNLNGSLLSVQPYMDLDLTHAREKGCHNQPPRASAPHGAYTHVHMAMVSLRDENGFIKLVESVLEGLRDAGNAS